MSFEEIQAQLQEKFGEAILEVETDEGRAGLLDTIVIGSENLLEVCRYLREESSLKFEYLNLITATDFKDSIHVAYVMTSYLHRQQLSLKVKLDREEPSVETVEGLWATANWHEREAFDLLGVIFEGHSDLRRILMPDDWVGYPLRKDYEEAPEYHGIPTTREKPLGKY